MYETAKASIKGIFCSGLKSKSVTGVGYCAFSQLQIVIPNTRMVHPKTFIT